MTDERDRYRDKHATPAAGTRATTQAERERAEWERLDRLHGGRLEDHERDTPVDMPLPALISRTDTRTKALTVSASAIEVRVGSLERGLAAVDKSVAVLGTKVDLVLEESKASRLERIEREAAAREDARTREERAEAAAKRDAASEEAQLAREAQAAQAALDFRRQKWIDAIKIIAPIVAALATILAGLAGAFR